jgi:hypothetical protein
MVNPWAAIPDAPPPAQAYASDPWAAFPDWPPAQAQFGDINPFAGSPDTPWSLPTSPLPSNAPWSVNELPPTGALFAAPKSFGQSAPQLAGDPWAAFPDWPPAQVRATGSDPWAMFLDWPPTQMPRESSFVNGLLALDALPSAPTSQAASDPWAMFSDWPPTQTQQAGGADPFATFPDVPSPSAGFGPWLEPVNNPSATTHFDPMQSLIDNALRQTDITGSNPNAYSSQFFQAASPTPMNAFASGSRLAMTDDPLNLKGRIRGEGGSGELPSGLTDFLYQRDGEIIAFARPDLAVVAGTGSSSVAPAADIRAMSAA